MSTRTTTRNLFLTSIGAIALSACGAGEPAATTPTAHSAHEDTAKAVQDGKTDKAHYDEGGEKHEHDFPAGVKTFHDTMAPLWHAEHGDKRTEDTCAGLAALREHAVAIGAAAVPEKVAGHEAEWKQSVDALVASVDALAAHCAVDGRPEFQALFTNVHKAFHALIGHLSEHKAESGEHKAEGGEHTH